MDQREEGAGTRRATGQAPGLNGSLAPAGKLWKEELSLCMWLGRGEVCKETAGE